MKKLVIRYKDYFVFVIAFSALFFIIKIFFLYLLPFIIGFAVSFLMYPIYRFMKKRLSFKPAFCATVITLFIFSIVIALFSFLLYLLIKEAYNLYSANASFFNEFFSQFDLSSTIKNISENSAVFSKLSDTAFSIARIIPIVITLFIISFVSTVCIINNLPVMKRALLSKFSDNTGKCVEVVINQSKHKFRKFIKSYMLLYTLTFIESVFVFTLIDLDYKLIFAFLATVSDILPVLGPGAIYLPVAVVKALSGDYLSAITLLIFWGIVVIIRQIIEPKLLSDSIKIHPLVVLSALYFSIISSNIWVLFYIVSIAVVYKILIESEVLVPIFRVSVDERHKVC